MTEYVGTTDPSKWPIDIRIIKNGDAMSPGLNSPPNIPHQELADRTSILKHRIDADTGIDVGSLNISITDKEKGFLNSKLITESGLTQRIENQNAIERLKIGVDLDFYPLYKTKVSEFDESQEYLLDKLTTKNDSIEIQKVVGANNEEKIMLSAPQYRKVKVAEDDTMSEFLIHKLLPSESIGIELRDVGGRKALKFFGRKGNTDESVKISPTDIIAKHLIDKLVVYEADGVMRILKKNEGNNEQLEIGINDNCIDTIHIADGAITASKIADGIFHGDSIAEKSIGTAQLADNCVTRDKIANGTIIADNISNNSIGSDAIINDSIIPSKIHESIAGAGLKQHSSSKELYVSTDNNTIEINNDILRLKGSSIDFEHISSTLLDDNSTGSESIWSAQKIQSVVNNTETASNTLLTTHLSDASNPHNVTASQLGLGNVDDTPDANKPISSATQTALDAKSDVSHHHDSEYYIKSTADIMFINSNKIEDSLTSSDATRVLSANQGKELNNRINNLTNTTQSSLMPQGNWNANTNTPDITSAASGEYWIVSVAGSTDLDGITEWNINDWAVKTSTGWAIIDNTDKVLSVNGVTGDVIIDADNISLGNVDNTSDINKPISSATQTALDDKSDITHTHDDRYYQESEVDSLLTNYIRTDLDYMSPPNQTNASRDALSGVPNGAFIFNTDTGIPQIYESGGWSDISIRTAFAHGIDDTQATTTISDIDTFTDLNVSYIGTGDEQNITFSNNIAKYTGHSSQTQMYHIKCCISGLMSSSTTAPLTFQIFRKRTAAEGGTDSFEPLAPAVYQFFEASTSKPITVNVCAVTKMCEDDEFKVMVQNNSDTTDIDIVSSGMMIF